MHVVLDGFENFGNPYMDDIIVEKLRHVSLTAKPSKFCWSEASLSYLRDVAVCEACNKERSTILS